ncbi:HIRAN domain-containing protein [Anaerobacillus sp. MEB173]|uniref:HIRAN domain-containing protein n=1 Tax=Anaerobacillus sp. MEB173 TaxID=3383345 RepID=UPI003F93D55D
MMKLIGSKRNGRRYNREQLRIIRSKVMTIAAALRKIHQWDKSRSLQRAWRMVKQQYYTKVVGVIFGRRQEAIKRLEKYDPRRIKVTLQHEPENKYDPNAVAVIVTVIGKGSYRVGYVRKIYASVYAQLLMKGYTLQAHLEGITKSKESAYYGLNISYVIDQVAYDVDQQEKRAYSRQEIRSLIG